MLSNASSTTGLTTTGKRFNGDWMRINGREGSFARNFPKTDNDPMSDIRAPAYALPGSVAMTSSAFVESTKPDAFVEREEHEMLVERDLSFPGYIPPGVGALKKLIMTSPKLTRAVLEDSDKQLRSVIASMELEMERGEESAGTHREDAAKQGYTLEINSLNHVRYIRLIALRRLGDFKGAVSLCREMINSDPSNVDAIEAHVEICLSSDEGLSILNGLLNGLRMAGMNDEGTLLVNEAPYEAAITFMADSLIGFTVHQVNENGEGTATKALQQVLKSVTDTLSRGNREGELGLLVQSIMDALDEQIHNAAFRSQAHLQIQTCITVLRVLLITEMYKGADTFGGCELLILIRLQTCLRMMGRLRECAVFADRMIRHMRTAIQYHRAKTPEAKAAIKIQGYNPKSVPAGELEAHIDAFRDCKFQHVHDIAVLNPKKAMAEVVKLVEEYPQYGVPWKILALVLHSDGKKGDAVVACRKAIETDPTDASSILLLGNLYLELKKFTLAAHLVESFRVMERLGPEALMENTIELPNDPDVAPGSPRTHMTQEVAEETSKSRRSEVAMDALALEEGLQEAADFTVGEIERLEQEYIVQMHRATLYTFQAQTPHDPQANRVSTTPTYGETPIMEDESAKVHPWNVTQKRRQLAAARLLTPPPA